MTAPLLPSYVAGRWYTAPDEGTPIADAVTGDVDVGGVAVAALGDGARPGAVGGTRGRRGDRDLFPAQHFGAAERMDAHAHRHVSRP